MSVHKVMKRMSVMKGRCVVLQHKQKDTYYLVQCATKFLVPFAARLCLFQRDKLWPHLPNFTLCNTLISN